MVMLLEGRHLQFFVYKKRDKKLDPSSYIWVLISLQSMQVLLEAISP